MNEPRRYVRVEPETQAMRYLGKGNEQAVVDWLSSFADTSVDSQTSGYCLLVASGRPPLVFTLAVGDWILRTDGHSCPWVKMSGERFDMEWEEVAL